MVEAVEGREGDGDRRLEGGYAHEDLSIAPGGELLRASGQGTPSPLFLCQSLQTK
jgi:hypothetical protein